MKILKLEQTQTSSRYLTQVLQIATPHYLLLTVSQTNLCEQVCFLVNLN